MAHFTGINAELKRIKDALKDLEKEAVGEVRAAAITVIKALQSKTPVWSGETVRNYAVKFQGGGGGSTRSAIGSGDPGNTNAMPLGPEPRRADNESAAIAEASSALSALTSLKTVTITNLVSDDKWNLIDSGSAPDPVRSRGKYPGGVGLMGLMTAKQRLGQDWK